MTKTVSPFTQIPSEPLAGPVTQYPFLVVRIYNTVYQREQIEIRQGKPAVKIGAGNSYVQHPEPWLLNNEISEGCRALLLVGVVSAVNTTGFRMCIKWGGRYLLLCRTQWRYQRVFTKPLRRNCYAVQTCI